MASGRQRFSIISDGLPSQLPDVDPAETQEWLESLDAVIKTEGRTRARYLMLQLLGARARAAGRRARPAQHRLHQHDPAGARAVVPRRRVRRAPDPRLHPLERRDHGVTGPTARTNVGGHIATYASAASLYEVGFNHFFRGKDHGESGDQVFIQGHASPGIYARAFLEGRLPRGAARRLPPGDLAPGRRPAVLPAPAADAGLLGVPHGLDGARPRSTRSTRPGSTATCYNRKIKDTSRSHVWAFLGDGEMDEPESLGAIGVAAREELDNLTFVVNCNLQRLDGPVRGNGKIIQELESYFRGAGWNVIKVVWGRDWDALLARDVDGVLVNAMNTTPDGQFQTYSVETGAFIREDFFGDDPRLRKMVEHLSDDEITQAVARRPRLPQGVRRLQGGPRARRPADRDPRPHHQGLDARQGLRGAQRHAPDEEADQGRAQGVPRPALPARSPTPRSRPTCRRTTTRARTSDEIQYMLERRAALGGFLPKRRQPRQAAQAARRRRSTTS